MKKYIKPTEEQIQRIKGIVECYSKFQPQYIDNMVANMCQQCNNAQITRAYLEIGVYDKMKLTKSVQRGKIVAIQTLKNDIEQVYKLSEETKDIDWAPLQIHYYNDLLELIAHEKLDV